MPYDAQLTFVPKSSGQTHCRKSMYRCISGHGLRPWEDIHFPGRHPGGNVQPLRNRERPDCGAKDRGGGYLAG